MIKDARAGNRDHELFEYRDHTSGLTDFQTVLDTVRTVLSVQDSIASIEGDRLTSLIQITQ
jgi:hypothetical protein